MKTILAAAALGALLGCSEGGERPRLAPPSAASTLPAVIPDSVRAFCVPPTAAAGDPLPEGAELLSLGAAYESQSSTLNAAVRCVLRTPAEWAAYRSAAGLTELPELGEGQVMLVAGSGWQASTGYDIEIDTVALSGRVATVVVRATSPEDGSTVGAAETSPVTALLIPAPVDSVVFLERP